MAIDKIPLVQRILDAQRNTTRFLWTSDARFTSRQVNDTTRLYFIGRRIVIPPDATDLITALLQAAHDASGHGGMDVTEAQLRPFWFDKKSETIRKYVASCRLCQHGKSPESKAITGPLNPQAYTRPFERVIMDYQGPFPKASNGHTYVLTFTDCFSRYTWAYTFASADSKTSVSALRAFCLSVDRPVTIQVDPGSHFQGSFPDFCTDSGIALHVTHSQHPQSNGIAERAHRTILDKLRVLTAPSSINTSWADMLPEVIHAINTTFNKSTQVSPHELLYAQKPRSFLDASLNLPLPEESAQDRASRANVIREIAAAASAAAALHSKADFDAKARPCPKFEPGDAVLVYFAHRENKLHKLFRGPFEIVSRDPSRGPNFFIVGNPESDGSTTNHQSLPADRLLPYDLSRSSYGDEEAYRTGPGYFVVDYIASHVPRVSHDREYDFLVKWRDHDEVSPGELEDLRHLPCFIKYCQDHNLTSVVRNQLRRERLRLKEALAVSSASSASSSASSSSASAAPSAVALPARSRAVRPARVTEFDSASPLDPAVLANARFQPGDRVFLDSYPGSILSVVATHGGKPWYDIAFDGYKPGKKSSQGYAEDTLTTSLPRRR